MDLTIGLDEAGRGPWAGPVYLGLCILTSQQEAFLKANGITDSKKLSENKRKTIYKLVKSNSLYSATFSLDVEEIDLLGIYKATIKGFEILIANLPEEYRQNSRVKIDGVFPQLKNKYECIINGDSIETSISAASILAKVERDEYMIELDKFYPQYFFGKHKGYGTSLHIEMLKKYGISPHHRKSFKPVAKLINRY